MSFSPLWIRIAGTPLISALFFLPLTAVAQMNFTLPSPAAMNNSPPPNELGVVEIPRTAQQDRRTACAPGSLFTFDQVSVIGCREVMTIETMDVLLRLLSDEKTGKSTDQKQDETDQALLDLIQKQAQELSELREEVRTLKEKVLKP